MALSDLYSNVLIWIRWLHVLLGLLWLGNLYFFDFVLLPMQNELRSPLLLRAVAWLRWSSMGAVLFGAVLFVLAYSYVPGQGFGPTTLLIADKAITDRAAWVLLGIVLAVVMWFNVWFVLVPAQTKLLTGKMSPEDAPMLRRRTARSLRTATFLSGPMLFTMLAPSHYGAINLTTIFVVLVVGFVLAGAAAKAFVR
jgi:uncharacterized membrane protein